jgi:murein DD-endopeptidase MepM/ murein hydrolase activator NlpD
LTLRRREAPRHRARATVRRRRRTGAFFSVGACLVGAGFGAHLVGGHPSRPARIVSTAVPTVAPAVSPLVANLVSSPPITLKEFDTGGIDLGPPPGLPLPAQYLRSGTVDQGVDYIAPGGTPLFAMGPGVIIQEGGPGTSGFGPNIPVLRITSGPLAGETVYYGHAGPDIVPVGTVVSAGQQIGIVGFGRVGRSSTPHLEIGFWPLGNMRAGKAMMAYLNQMMGHTTGR